jgi:hypothetical protein
MTQAELEERQSWRLALMAAQETLCLLIGSRDYPIAPHKENRRKETLRMVNAALRDSDGDARNCKIPYCDAGPNSGSNL